MNKRHIQIFDTTLRDGEQAPGASITPEQKIVLARQLGRLGIDVIEPGFPVSSQGEFEAVQQICRELQHVEICGFARAVKGDIDRAVEATKDAARRRLHIFISSSDIHLQYQLRKTRDEVLAMTREKIAYAKQFVDEIEFSPMDATRSDEAFLMEMLETAISEGATILNIPDTVGYALPEEFGAFIRRLREGVRGADRVRFSAHCHNDLGLAVANSLAAIRAGADQIEVTVGGIGERAGNCSLEELVMAIETRKEALEAETRIDVSQLYDTSRMVSRMMHFPIAHNKPIVGRNAFQHEAGIHQDGLLKNRNTYEIMDPEALGIPRNMIVLGKHSGRHAIKHRIAELGIPLDEGQLNEVYERFKETADRQKTVSDTELAAIAGTVADVVVEPIVMRQWHVQRVNDQHNAARVTLFDQVKKEEQQYEMVAEGPVHALVQCIRQAYPDDIEFEDLEIYSLSSGEAAKGEAIVTVRRNGNRYRGQVTDYDVLQAVAHAFVSACNQAIVKS
ncbi:2-isopropylmalate synthase [Marinicrinis lubricantis]|uniref:2-isopropylmalate synthase n=1 Tax=Marinicrinis lubricantis TaxID=2086470 RepID=A0ABW1IPT6_9BACL